MKPIKYLSGFLLVLICSVAVADTTGLILQGDLPASHWQSKNSSIFISLSSIIQHKNDFIAAGKQIKVKNEENAVIFKSSDSGNTWEMSSLSEYPANLNKVVSGGTILVAVGNDSTILTSIDNGNTWKKPEIVPDILKTKKVSIKSLGFDGTSFIAAGMYRVNAYFNRAVMLKSDDQGKTWHDLTDLMPKPVLNDTSINENSINWDGNQWVMIGEYSGTSSKGFPARFPFVLTSPKTLNWTSHSLPEGLLPIEGPMKVISLTMKGNQWNLYIGPFYKSMIVLTSNDQGQTWKEHRGIPLPNDNIEKISKIASNGSTWVAVGQEVIDRYFDQRSLPIIMTSNNGINNWVSQKLPNEVITYYGEALVKDVISVGSNWFAVGEYGRATPGCQSYQGEFIGKLSAGDVTITVQKFGLTLIKPSGQGNYDVGGGGVTYSTGPGTEYGYGLAGTCKEEGKIATINVSNGGVPASMVAEKELNGNEIKVTKSSLGVTVCNQKGSCHTEYKNFVGTLKRK